MNINRCAALGNKVFRLGNAIRLEREKIETIFSQDISSPRSELGNQATFMTSKVGYGLMIVSKNGRRNDGSIFYDIE